MKNINTFKNFVLTTIGLVVISGSFVNAQQITGKGSASLAPTTSTTTQNVKVVNTSAEPVPVAINGTPTVQVSNSTANPLLIRNVDSQPSQPFQATLKPSFAAGDQGSEPNNTLAVPVGKRLVIKYITLYVDVPPDQFVTGDLTAGSSGGILFNPVSWFVMSRQAGASGQDTIYTASQPVEIYLDAGTEFWAEFFRSSGTGSGYARVVVSGYMVNVTQGN